MSIVTTGRVRRKTFVCAAVAALSIMSLTACRETNPYMSRRDSIRLGVGDAVAHNRAVHTIDPWPVYSKDTDIPADGKRMMVAIERYQANESIDPEPVDTTERFKKEDGPDGPPPGPPSQ